MINNLELIKPFIKPINEDDFWYLQILKRKKDQSEEEKVLGRNNNARTIKNYYINNIDYLEDKIPEIIKLCNNFSARASIRLNKRSYKKVGFRTLSKIAGIMENGHMHHVKTAYSKACGTGNNAGKNKTWILDCDFNFYKYFDKESFEHELSKFQPENNGYKILTIEELYDKFEAKHEHIDFKSDKYLLKNKNGIIKDFCCETYPDGMFSDIIIRSKSIKHKKIKSLIPSKNGMHVISTPFNVQEADHFLKEWKIEIHKDNPTNLYIP